MLRSLIVLLVLGASTALAVPTVAAAPRTPPWMGNKGQLDKTIAFLQKVQNPDGGFPGVPGGASDPGFSAWVAMGLAAGGVNPQDQKTAGGGDLWSYIVAHAPELKYTTDFERVMLAAISAGEDPTNVGGRNLVATILSRQLADGSFPHAAGGHTGGINDTAFAILPLSTVDDPAVKTVIARAAGWLRDAQGHDGGWSYAPTLGESSDMTAAVIEALRAAGIGGGPAEDDGWKYIAETQQSDGGFSQMPSEHVSNAASTAWVVQAMWAAGVDPGTWTQGGASPLDYLASLQLPDGAIQYRVGDGYKDNVIWMTAYVAPAFAGYPPPPPAVPRAVVTPVVTTTTSTTPTTTTGVTSGGGGGGAPLFSRPQPGSDGDASGGVRHLHVTGTPAKHLREPVTQTQRSANRKGSRTGTAQSNGTANSGVTPVVSVERKHGGTAPEPSAKPPSAKPATTKTGGHGGGDTGDGEEVTGHLLGRAPAGVSGTGRNVGYAPGLRSAIPPPDDASTTALIFVLLLVAAGLAGARFEATTPKETLVP